VISCAIGFRNQLAGVTGVVQVRGQGLIIGIELAVPCVELVRKALAKKLLINVTSDKVIRLLPAFVMQQAEAEQVVDMTCELIKEFLNG
jgi:acetylornithine/N-succinyldiaminopimelate aminotransferase